MFHHTAWTDGIERAERYRREADEHRALVTAGFATWPRRAASTALRRTADHLARIADRLVPVATPQPQHHARQATRSRRSSATGA